MFSLIVSWLYQFGCRYPRLRTLLFRMRWHFAFHGIRGDSPPVGVTFVPELLKENAGWFSVDDHWCRGDLPFPQQGRSREFDPGGSADHMVVCVRNGRLWGGGAVITPDQRVLRDRSPELGAPLRWHRALLLPCLPKSSRSWDRLVSLSVNADHRNFFHWLLDEFARLAFLPDSIDDPIFLYSSQSWQRQFLDLAGIPPERCVSAGVSECVEARTLIIPPLVGYGDTVKVRHAVAFLRRLRDRHFSTPPNRHAVYLRRGIASRRPVNDDALVEALIRRGVQVLDPGRISVSEQVQSLHGARLILAAHGAAMANMVFAEPGARVIEFRSLHYRNRFSGLAKACGHQYHECVGSVPLSECWRPVTQRGYSIPIKKVLRLVDETGI